MLRKQYAIYSDEYHRACNKWTTAHLSACHREIPVLQPSLVMFPSFLFPSAECIFKFARTALRSREREPRSRVARVRQTLAPLLVSHFVVTVLSKVAISRSKCHCARSKSDKIVKNSTLLRNQSAIADNWRVIARRLQTFRRRQLFSVKSYRNSCN